MLAGAAGAVYGAVKGIQFVREGERAIMLRFDKAIKRGGQYKVIFPGLRLMIPGIHKLARQHVRQRTINFQSQVIVLSDRTVFEVSAVLLCRVKDTPKDLYNSLFETANLNGALADYGLMVIRKVLADKGYENLFDEGRDEISQQLSELMAPKAAEWGVEVLQFELSDCNPTDETARLIQTSAQAEFKLKALEEAAKQLGCRVADLDPTLAAVMVGMPLVANVNRTAS